MSDVALGDDLDDEAPSKDKPSEELKEQAQLLQGWVKSKNIAEDLTPEELGKIGSLHA